MTIKTCGSPVGQAATAVRKYIAKTAALRLSKESGPDDGLYLQIAAPERPMDVAMHLADYFESAAGGWLTYDLESSQFFIKLDEGGRYWLNEEEMVICCYSLLWTSYYLDGDEKRPFKPNISRVTEVMTALKALRVETER